MMGEVEAQQEGSLADIVSLHQQTLCLVDDIVVNVANSRATSGLVDNIAKITRRIGQFGSAPSDGRQTLHQLTVLNVSAGRSLPYPLRTVGAGRCGCSIPVSGADSPAVHFEVKGNPHVSITLAASVTPTA